MITSYAGAGRQDIALRCSEIALRYESINLSPAASQSVATRHRARSVTPALGSVKLKHAPCETFRPTIRPPCASMIVRQMA